MTGMLLIGTQTLGIGSAYKSLQEQLKLKFLSRVSAVRRITKHKKWA
jgi:hypothetical protein